MVFSSPQLPVLTKSVALLQGVAAGQPYFVLETNVSRIPAIIPSSQCLGRCHGKPCGRILDLACECLVGYLSFETHSLPRMVFHPRMLQAVLYTHTGQWETPHLSQDGR